MEQRNSGGRWGNFSLVFTLAVGRDGKATDAYNRETRDIAAFFAEAESVAARKATVIDPTEDDETVKVSAVASSPTRRTTASGRVQHLRAHRHRQEGPATRCRALHMSTDPVGVGVRENPDFMRLSG